MGKKYVLSLSSCVRVFTTPWAIALQAPLSTGILQARILEWVAMPSSRGSSQPRDRTWVFSATHKFFTIWATREANGLYTAPVPRREVQFSSVAQSCPTLCDSMDCITPGFPVHHQLQTHVHWVSEAIQPSHPLSSPAPPAFNHFQHQGFFKQVSSSHQVAKVLEFQLQRQSFQWIFGTDFLHNRLVLSPLSPRDSQESSPVP